MLAIHDPGPPEPETKFTPAVTGNPTLARDANQEAPRLLRGRPGSLSPAGPSSLRGRVLIVTDQFRLPTAAVSGFAGATLAQGFRYGAARGIFSDATQKCATRHGKDLKGAKVAKVSCFACHDQSWKQASASV